MQSESPYSMELEKSGNELAIKFFEPEVLDRYSDDNHYDLDVYDYGGRVNGIGIQTFGLGYDRGGLPLVVVALIYLTYLDQTHQLHWKSFEVLDPTECKVSSAYGNQFLRGRTPDSPSVYIALLREQHEINRICRLLNIEVMFKELYVEKRPEGFHFLLKPTKKRYHEFVMTLARMITDNLNAKLFRSESDSENSSERSKGTISLLENWLSEYLSTSKNEIGAIIKPLRKLQKPRGIHAHSFVETIRDPKFLVDQSHILFEVYESVRCLRMLLAERAGVPTSSDPRLCKAVEYL